MLRKKLPGKMVLSGRGKEVVEGKREEIRGGAWAMAGRFAESASENPFPTET
ncbi:hypothetical protein NXH76_25625 [Blautia schinkii]|nr:hypothetical protein [Blautia schinkii]